VGVLAPYTELLQAAKEHRFTVGAFNSFDMETVKAITSAADETDVPLIVQIYHSDLDFAGADYMYALCSAAARNSRVKIALGLDHGRSFEQAKHCIENHFTGVMIDLSTQDFDRNVYETKKVAALAHAHGVSVEAEIGEIKDASDSLESIASGYTDPAAAQRFVKETGVDCLAVSIGTAHGIYAHTPKINFGLLKELIRDVPCPIVVHGGSNTPDEDIVEMARLGVAKLNIGTDLFHAYTDGLLGALQEKGAHSPAKEILRAGQENVKKAALHKLGLLTRFRK
jgi:ketose-bisphosphate aldolase